MNLTKVETDVSKKAFHDVGRIIYKDDPNRICPLDSEIEQIFDPEKNNKLKTGKACRWVLRTQENGKLIGRIAAFIDTDYSNKQKQPTGGIGFFECIDDNKAAHLLFDAAKYWLKNNRMEAIDGPINFGSHESYWGLLVSGFMPQAYGMPYHKPYYQKLFEEYGFHVYYKQYSYHIDLTKPISERFWKIADWVKQKGGYEVRCFNFVEKEKFFRDFLKIYNTTWPTFKEDFIPMTINDIANIFESAKSVLIEEFVVFAYHEGEPIGFYINLPDINQVLKHFNGKLSFFSKLKFLYLLKYTKTVTRLRGIIYGIVPKYQKSGIDAAIFAYLRDVLKEKPHYKEVELSWVGDFNPKMMNFRQRLGAYLAKKYNTYRYTFEPEIKNGIRQRD